MLELYTNVCWTVLSLNTTPQFVGEFQHIEVLTLLKWNHITWLLLDSVLIPVQGLMACSLTSVAHTADVDQTLLQNLYTLRLSVVEPHAQGIC